MTVSARTLAGTVVAIPRAVALAAALCGGCVGTTVVGTGSPAVEGADAGPGRDNARDGDEADAGVGVSGDAAPPSGETLTYVAICVTSLASRDPKQALRFRVRAALTHTSLDLSGRPLVGYDVPGNTPITPPEVSPTWERGDAFTGSAPVDDFSFRLDVGTIDLPAEANSISGRDARYEDVVFEGRVSTGHRFCARMAGKMTVPYTLVLDPSKNTCLFVKVDDGDPVPTFGEADFVCR